MENQIEEARRRAYSYAQSLSGVREQDVSRAKSFEENRDRWARTFEEKSILIEQLERELQFAIEALDSQREQNVRRSNSSIILDDDKINSDFKKLMHSQSPTRSPSRRSVETSRMSAINRSFAPDLYQNGLFRTTQPQPLFPDATSNISAVNSTSHQHNGVDVWNHLLDQYKEQLQRTREEVTMLSQEKKDLVQRLLSITKELTIVADERDQIKLAIEDMEGKLQFRSAQVREYELERNSLLDVDGSKAVTIERLQNEVGSLKFQVQSMERENKVSLQTIASLQQDIQKNSLDLSRNPFADELREKDQEIFRLRHQLNEKDHAVQQELAESKQLVRSLQLRLSNAESLNQVSHLEQRYDRTFDPTSNFRREQTSSASPIATARSRTESHSHPHEIDAISSGLKRSSSNDKLSRSPSKDNVSGAVVRSPSRTGSDMKLSVDTGSGLTRSPSKSKLMTSNNSSQINDHHSHHSSRHHSTVHSTLGTASPRRSNSAVNFRDEEDVHVFSTNAASSDKRPPRPSLNTHHHESEASKSAEHGDSEDEDGVYEVESAYDIFRPMDDYDLRRSKSSKDSNKSKKSSKKSSSSHKDVSSSTKASSPSKATFAPPSVTVSPKSKMISKSSTGGGHSSLSSPGASTTPILKSALKGKLLHVLGSDIQPVVHTQHVPVHHSATHRPSSRDPHVVVANGYHRLAQSEERSASKTPDNRSRSNSRDSPSAHAVRVSLSDSKILRSTAVIKAASKPSANIKQNSSSSRSSRLDQGMTTGSKMQNQPVVIPSQSSSRTPSRVPSVPSAGAQYAQPEEDSHSIVSLSSSSSSSYSSSGSSSSTSSSGRKHKKSKKKKTKTSSSRPVAKNSTGRAAAVSTTGSKNKSAGTGDRNTRDKPKKLTKKLPSRSASPADALRRSSSFASLPSQHLDETVEHRRSSRHKHPAGTSSPNTSAAAASSARSRSASAHSRVSSSSLTPVPETKPFMRPTSSFRGKIIPHNAM
jgi:hypothetical protein